MGQARLIQFCFGLEQAELVLGCVMMDIYIMANTLAQSIPTKTLESKLNTKDPSIGKHILASPIT
jgi:hypothetical protein